MRPNYAGIPDEMKAYPQWVCWRDVNQTKVLYDPKQTKEADVTKPETWTTFEYAKDICERYPSYYQGVGFVLTKDDPYTMMDIDLKKVLDKDIARKYQDIAETVDSYTEISPSGNGLHVIAKAKLSDGRRGNGSFQHIELYPHLRYTTMTGVSLHNPPKLICDRQLMLSELFDRLHADKTKMNGAEYVPTVDPTMVNERILYENHTIYNKCAASPSFGPKFVELYAGRWQQYIPQYPSQSEADQALMNMLAMYSRNRQQLKDMFLASGLGQRDKARKRTDYVERTITAALDSIVDPVEIERMQNTLRVMFPQKENAPDTMTGGVGSDNTNGRGAAIPFGEGDMRNTPGEPTRTVMDEFAQVNTLVRPPGLMGDIADFIYNYAPVPLPEAALCGAIGLMAGICGKSFMTPTNAGLNMYVLCIALTGSGKESMRRGIMKLVKSVSEYIPNRGGNQPVASIHNNVELADIQSQQALMKVLKQKPCHVAITGEFGLFLKQVASDNAPQYLAGLLRRLLELYGLSGEDTITGGLRYSKKENDIDDIRGTAFSILGETTPNAYYQAISRDLVSKGLIPRFICLESLKRPSEYHEQAGFIEPPPELVAKLAEYVVTCHSMAQRGTIIRTVWSPEADELQKTYRLKCGSFLNKVDLMDDAVQHLWSRAHLNAMKLATLATASDTPHNAIIKPEWWQWSERLVTNSVLNVISHFETGDIGGNTQERDQRETVIEAIHFYLSTPYPLLHQKGYLNVKDGARMHDQKWIPKGFFSKRCQNRKGFVGKDYNRSLFNILRELEQEGMLLIQKANTVGFDSSSTVYFVIDEAEFARKYQRQNPYGR